MRRLITILGLEAYALSLALLQALHGVGTDEAKYLLNIPYPHPPLLRSLMGITSFLPGQEILWRILLATLLIQAVWVVRALLPRELQRERLALGGLWLFSVPVILEAGGILLTPVIAFLALVFCWLLTREEPLEGSASWIILLWLASLFTAYQAVLFLPLVVVVFWRMQLSLKLKLSCVAGPVLLLGLYTLTNPLAVASMMTAGEQNASSGTLLDAFRGVAWLWGFGGSLIVSVLGTIGMLRARRWELLCSLLLVAAFILVSYRSYYALLFTPLLIAGIAASPRLLRWPAITVGATLIGAVFLILFVSPRVEPSPARATMHTLIAKGVDEGTLLIAGSFGHEWQYESPLLVRRYVTDPRQIDSARAIVCLNDCPEVRWRQRWRPMAEVPVEVWVRKLGNER